MSKIKLEVVDEATDHFIMRFEAPARVEVSLIGDGRIIAHAYFGTETDMEQDPALVYDGYERMVSK